MLATLSFLRLNSELKHSGISRLYMQVSQLPNQGKYGIAGYAIDVVVDVKRKVQ